MNNIMSFFVIIIIVTSCATKKASYFYSEKNHHSAQEIVKQVNNSTQAPNSISLKGKIKITNHTALNNNKLQLNINIKAKKDSLIWISIIAPFTSVEVSRIQITKDSIYYVNRVERKFFVKAIKNFESYLDSNITISELYNVLTASPRLIKDEYMVFLEKENYVLKSDRKEYVVEPKRYKIISGTIQENIKYQFANYTKEDKYYFPYIFQLNITNNKENTVFLIEYSRVRLNQSQNTSFKIPKHYAKIN